jgi:16S rRNA G966 N2-methylase RsmD
MKNDSVWQGCYDGSWKGVITPESFAHPAKMARGLLTRIFDYAFKQGWLRKGDIVADPFGGIGSTGIEGASRGCRVFLCELEPRFVALAETNFALHRRTWETCGDPLPVIVQGDSRRLCEVLGPVMADCVVSSPPFQESISLDRSNAAERRRVARERGISAEHISPIEMEKLGMRHEGAYGQTPGQLGAMKADDVAAVISSPPYASGTVHDGNGIDESKLTGNKAGRNTQAKTEGYGRSEGNIGNMPTGMVDAVVSSPPYAECLRGDGTQKETAAESQAKRLTPGGSLGQSQRTAGYGSAGNLGNLPTGSVADYLVSSPPFEASLATNVNTIGFENITGNMHRKPGKTSPSEVKQDYGSTPGNVGNDTGATFWQAAKEIVQQCYQILKPGGVAFWVCKDFVRKRQRVPFSADWLRLCEACGFEVVEWVRASLVKRESQPGLFGEEIVKTKSRKSFFRRLTEKKGSPPIDCEDVLIVRKPMETIS